MAIDISDNYSPYIEIKEKPTVRKKSFGKKSIFNKIKDIQNGKEEEGK